MSITIESPQVFTDMVAAAMQKANKRSRNDRGRGHPKLGAILARHLAEHDLSQSELATAISRHPSFINKIIQGERGMSIETLAAIQKVLPGMFSIEYLDTLHALETDTESESVHLISRVHQPWIEAMS